MNWTSVPIVASLAILLGASLPAVAEPDKVKLGERINFNSSICFDLADLMEIREYALKNDGDGYTPYIKKKGEGKCMAFNSMEIGVYAILDEVVPNSEFNDSTLGPSVFVKFHIEGNDKFLYGVMGPEQLDLSSI